MPQNKQAMKIRSVKCDVVAKFTATLFAIVFFCGAFALSANAQEQNERKPKSKLTPLRTAETEKGSQLTITSTSPLNDYSAYRIGDRFYVHIPNADAAAVKSGMSGRGFADARVQRRGDDVVLSFRVQEGAKPRVSQRFNKLDVIFATQEGGQASQTTRTRPSDAQQQQQRQPAQQSSNPLTSPTQQTAAGAASVSAQSGTTQQPPPAIQQENPVAPTDPAGTGDQSNESAEQASSSASVEERAATPSQTEIAEARAQEVSPAKITTAPATSQQPSASIGAAVARNWPLAVIAALLLLGFGLFLATRRASGASSPKTGTPAGLGKVDDDRPVALDEKRALADEPEAVTIVSRKSAANESPIEKSVETARGAKEESASLSAPSFEAETESGLASMPVVLIPESKPAKGGKKKKRKKDKKEKKRAASLAAPSQEKPQSIAEEPSTTEAPTSPAIETSGTEATASQIEAVEQVEATAPVEAEAQTEADAQTEVASPVETSERFEAEETEARVETVPSIEPSAPIETDSQADETRSFEAEDAETSVARDYAASPTVDASRVAEDSEPAVAEADLEASPAAREDAEIESAPLDFESAAGTTAEAEREETATQQEAATEVAEAETSGVSDITTSEEEALTFEDASLDEKSSAFEEAPGAQEESFVEEDSRIEESVSAGDAPSASEVATPSPVYASQEASVESANEEDASVASQIALEADAVQEETSKLLAGEDYDQGLSAVTDPLARQIIASELLSALAGRNLERRARAYVAFVEYGYFNETSRELHEAEAPAARASAARALGLLGDSMGTSHLVAALHDDSLEVRRAAVEALVGLRDPKAVGPLEELLEREKSERIKLPRRLILNAIEICSEGSNISGRSEEAATPAYEDAQIEASRTHEPESAPPSETDANDLSETYIDSEAEATESASLSASSEIYETESSYDVAPPLDFEFDRTGEVEAFAPNESAKYVDDTPEEISTQKLYGKETRNDWIDLDLNEARKDFPNVSQDSVESQVANEASTATSEEIEELASQPVAEYSSPSDTAGVAEDGSRGFVGESAPSEPRIATPLEELEALSSSVEAASPEAQPASETGEISSEIKAIASAAEIETGKGAARYKTPADEAKAISPFVTDDASAVPKGIQLRLLSEEPNERATGLRELANVNADDAFRVICTGFDDPTPEVRNAAAVALYNLQEDRAETYTRALREAGSQRRRAIGAALASSGLANEAVSHLTGESREKTYDAFSLLFLMAKAGEVQPLISAVEAHPDTEVRLAVVKLLALSGQKEVVPAFRRLVLRDTLPQEVRAAVMEAIYQISSQTPVA